ncbi:GNAT family N-acetyltransferase [Phenylobacterium sp. J367]|uniref:GNAT family N-acetyltransferase n=1 Tax=Phenylobacterium sp. J367 TaxID=2898435 RepID=UPI002150E566|nr:GNAT family N-acetyltransferase [Phenylobacterium sp. J367]MCR5877050.1 GNAT family N-acetyltransferase [Phenylobacterium sp. J367]
MTFDVTIRPAGPQDAAALALVGQATFLESYADVLPAADILDHCRGENGEARYAGWLGTPGYAFWLAQCAQGAPVGFAMLSPPDLPVPTDDGDVELKRLYLLHRFHGGGLGARLMETAIAHGRAVGARRLLLGVFGLNTNAIAFYARQGFSQAGVRKFRVGANEYDDLVLARSLQA